MCGIFVPVQGEKSSENIQNRSEIMDMAANVQRNAVELNGFSTIRIAKITDNPAEIPSKTQFPCFWRARSTTHWSLAMPSARMKTL